MCKAVQWFRGKDNASKSELCTCTDEEVLFLLYFRSEDSGAKRFSDLEATISKSELYTGTAEEVVYLLCLWSEGSGAKQCGGFEGKISKSELCTGTAAEILYLWCFKSKAWYLLCLRRLSRAKYGQSPSGSAVDVPNLERELMFGAKPWAGAHFSSQSSSGSTGFLS